MKKTHYSLSAFLLTLFFSISFSSFGQTCNPTENWLNTGFPGTNANLMTEMNGNLYTVNFHVPRQEYVLYKYDGVLWTEMSAFPVGGIHYSIASYQGQIYLAGSYPIFNVEGITRWDSLTNQWLSVGGGMGGLGSGVILDMKVFQGELYAAGTFDSIGGIHANGLARWNGTRWDSVGNQSLLAPLPNRRSAYFNCLHSWNNQLAVGGSFEISGSQYLALWDGTTWSGIPGSPNNEVKEMVTYNNDLVIFGPAIDSVGNTAIRHIARWDGTNWHAMGMAASDFVDLRDMHVYNGELYITGPTGFYTVGGGMTFDGMAKWNGTQWYILTGFDGFGYELREYKNRLYLNGALNSSCNRPIENVVKLCSYLECQPVSGHVYQDDNSNCSSDSTEFPMAQQWINIQPGNYAAPTDASGDYYILLDTGAYTIDITTLPNNYTSKCPANGHNVTLNAAGGATGLDFGYVPVANITDLNITGTTTRFRPGFTGRVYVNFGNVGTTSHNGTIDLTLDAGMTAGLSSQTIASQTGQTVTWNFTGLNPTQVGGIWLEAALDTSVQLGDTLCLIVNITSPVGTEATPADNSDTLKVIVTGSYDPNDKQVSPAGEGVTGDIPVETEALTYTVRFQNTGTDTAFTVLIRDEIDPNLDLGTLSILGASHAYKFEVEEGQKVKWTFDNILLADSNTNEPASHGFIKYQINLKPNLPIGTQIENTAYIYFDFNAPIVTNTTISTLVNPTTAIESIPQVSRLKVWPNPASDEVHFRLDNQVHNGVLTILDLQGRTVVTKKNISEREFRVSLHGLLSGMYMYRLEEKGKVLGVGKMVVK
ncbi:MAG: T9SS type A sorting domain-containing protein [Bacteroidia bacterium]